MKKLLGILVLFLFCCNVSFAKIIELKCKLISMEGDDRITKEDVDHLKKCNEETIYKINFENLKVYADKQGCPPIDNVFLGNLSDDHLDNYLFWNRLGKAKLEGNEVVVLLTYHYYKDKKIFYREDYIAQSLKRVEDLVAGKTPIKENYEKVITHKRKCI